MSRTIPILPAQPQATPGTLEFRKSPALSLYVHIPWCVRKCPYCDFNSHEADGGIPEREYVDALIADLQSALPLIWGRPVVSVFFGGGTPSLLSPAAIDELLAAFRALAMLSPEAEVTLEANPGTVEAAKFAGFRSAGVNRLSLGIQSFNDTHLQALGRIHGAAEARQAAQLAREHFERFNLDLMYGLPGQTMAQALDDLETALSFAPTHLSCYQLTLEPNTRFAAFPPELPESDQCADMQEAIEARLAAAGFRNYETSAFARPEWLCRHNLNYWHNGEYLGFGIAAHGVVREKRWTRYANVSTLEEYARLLAKGRRPLAETIRLAPKDEMFECVMLGFRLVLGIDRADFLKRFGLDVVEAYPKAMDNLRTRGWVEETEVFVALNRKGLDLQNEALGFFL